jgi:hypothetical protein
MNSRNLAVCVEEGLRHLREVSGLPEYLAPDAFLVAQELGDRKMLDLAEPLGLTQDIQSWLNGLDRAPEVNGETWTKGISHWQFIDRVVPITLAVVRARERIEALERRGTITVDSRIVRALATIACASFVPGGDRILGRLAVILDGDPTEPVVLLARYVNAIEGGDGDVLGEVEECILKDPAWSRWSDGFLAEGSALPFVPRLVGIRPAASSALIQVLAAMVREATDADRIRDTRN